MTTELPASESNSMPDNPADFSKIIELSFDQLRCFETIAEQFADLGIFFENTVILQPSNAAYLPEDGGMVLMAAPQSGWIKICFTVPVAYFGCILTSSQHSTVKAYDCDETVLQTFDTDGADLNAVNPLISTPPPNIPVEMQVQNIQRIVMNALDGQLVIHTIRFGF